MRLPVLVNPGKCSLTTFSVVACSMLILKRLGCPWASICVEDTPLSSKGRFCVVLPKLANTGVERILATTALKTIALIFMVVYSAGYLQFNNNLRV